MLSRVAYRQTKVWSQDKHSIVKNTTNGGNALKQDVESLIMPLQAACYAFSSEMLDAKL